MKFCLPWLLAGIFLLLSQKAIAQLTSVSVDLTVSNPNARVFYSGDINFSGFQNTPNLFRLELANDGDTPVSMSFNFAISLEGIEFVTSHSNNFQLPAHSTNIFSNEQLDMGAAVIRDQNGLPVGSPVRLNDYLINFGRIKNMQRAVFSTGKLPAGRYIFSVTAAVQQNGSQLTVSDKNPADNILTISNPTTIEPLYPGNRADSGYIENVAVDFPYFFWQSDAVTFNLFIFKKYPADKAIQDVLAHDPILHIEGYPNRIFQYPPDSSPLIFYGQDGTVSGRSVGPVRPLEPGSVYYWYVQGQVMTTSGETTINSEVFRFRLSKPAQSSSESNLILVYLKQIFGGRYNDFMRGLQGYEPTGTLTLNGSPAKPELLLDLITELNRDKAKIDKITIE